METDLNTIFGDAVFVSAPAPSDASQIPPAPLSREFAAAPTMCCGACSLHSTGVAL